MTTSPPDDPGARFRAAVVASARSTLGQDVPLGTTVVGSADRQGSSAAVAYPLGDRTIIWCAHDLAARLESLNKADPLTVHQFVDAGQSLGGSVAGFGNHRVLTAEPNTLAADGYRIVALQRDDPADRLLLAEFIDACSADDLDEAELAMDELDSAITVLVDDSGSIASYASGRPWAMDDDFDDIGVITHPDHRGRRLGASVDAAFCRRRQTKGRLLLYNCNVDNLGSNRVAETVGFELATTVAAVTFD